MGLTLENLKLAVRGALDNKAKYVGVAVRNEMIEQTEIIINTTSNMLRGKLDYYLSAYNNDLTLKTNNKIRIVGFTFADTANDIFEDLAY